MSKKFLQLVPSDGYTVLRLGEMEIWDGADMALLRESLTRLIRAEKHRKIGIDMSHVKYIPSGFFGMLFDWYETGVQIRLYSPQPNVRRMLWFVHFFEPVEAQGFQLAPHSTRSLPLGYPVKEAETPAPGSRPDPKRLVARAAR